MNRLVGLFVGLLASTASVVPTTATYANSLKDTVYINHTYGGVHRCGKQQNLAEAENAALKYVNRLSNEFRRPVFLVNHSIVNQGTRHWEERDRLGFSKGRKCQTTMRIKVDYEIPARRR